MQSSNVSPLRLSEAIRLGSMLKPQGFQYLNRDGNSCALGAALDACGLTCASDSVEDETKSYDQLRKLWPMLERESLIPIGPFTGQFRCHSLWRFIAELNDSGHHTREQIANIVESIEMNMGLPPIGPSVEPQEQRTWHSTSKDTSIATPQASLKCATRPCS